MEGLPESQYWQSIRIVVREPDSGRAFWLLMLGRDPVSCDFTGDRILVESLDEGGSWTVVDLPFDSTVNDIRFSTEANRLLMATSGGVYGYRPKGF